MSGFSSWISSRRRIAVVAVAALVLILGTSVAVAASGTGDDTEAQRDTDSTILDSPSSERSSSESDSYGTSDYGSPSDDTEYYQYEEDEPSVEPEDAEEPSGTEESTTSGDVEAYYDSQITQRQLGVDNESLLNKNADIARNNIRNSTGW